MPVLELTDEQAVSLLNHLPTAQRERVLTRLTQSTQPKKRPQFGGAKDDILFISDDFDAPLDDFKEYME